MFVAGKMFETKAEADAWMEEQTRMHPDPEINAELKADKAQADAYDVTAGISPERRGWIILQLSRSDPSASGGCEKCGVATFGRRCAKCSGEVPRA